jgi:hypothetical protein
MISRSILILILVSILVPCSLNISWSIGRDVAFYSFALVAVCWALVRQDSYIFTESSSSTTFQFPSDVTLVISLVIFFINLIVIYVQSRFIKGSATKLTILIVIGVALALQVFWISNWWLFFDTSAYGAYPFPIFLILNVVSVFWQREPSLSGSEKGDK